MMQSGGLIRYDCGMHITKFGHCCLLIEIDGKKVLTDPGTFTIEETKSLDGIDLVVISHEHADHFHVDSVKDVLARNPNAKVVSNSAVGKLLDEAGIPHEVLEGAGAREIAGVALAACDAKHEEIFEAYGQVQNTGYMIGGRLFYPGDAYADPGTAIDVLALPVAGPWCKIADALHYCIRMKPRMAFPVHDGMLGDLTFMHRVPQMILKEKGIDFVPMDKGASRDF